MPASLPIIDDEPAILTDWPAEPPWPHLPTVEWQVCGGCNYDCSYCIQSKKYRVGYPDETSVERALDFLCALNGAWDIKTTGGEPFSFKLFLDRIVPRLMQESQHHFSTLTNLSAPIRQLERFAQLTYGRLHVLSASLHLEFADVDSFVEKMLFLQKHTDQQKNKAHLVVNSVLVPDRLSDVWRAKDAVEAAGLRFFPQLMKVKNGVYAYTSAQIREIERVLGDFSVAQSEKRANLAPAYTQKVCYTGSRYFVLMQNGDAWSCRTAKRYEQGYLGNVFSYINTSTHTSTDTSTNTSTNTSSVELRAGPIRCPYGICPCSVPANRGMIEGIPYTHTRSDEDLL